MMPQKETCTAALQRASLELDGVADILSHFQQKIANRLASEINLSSDEVIALQNIDLAQQTITCVSLYLLQLSGSSDRDIELTPADIAARLKGITQTSSLDDNYLF